MKDILRSVFLKRFRSYFLETAAITQMLSGRSPDFFSNGSLLPGRIKALLYALLTDISLEVRHARLRGKSYASIWPAIEYLEKNFLKSPSISELARMCSVSESCFRRLFKEYAGMAPLEYILRLKLNRARLLLENGSLTVGEAAAAAGFDDPAYFSRLYKQKTGVSPIETLRGRFNAAVIFSEKPKRS